MSPCGEASSERPGGDDSGRRTGRDPIGSGSYALATAIHLRYHHVGQGEATAALVPTVVRRMDPVEADAAIRLAEALEVGKVGMSTAEANAASADALTAFYRSIGMPLRVRELEIPRQDLPLLARAALKNFNANPGQRSADQVEWMLALLEAAW